MAKRPLRILMVSDEWRPYIGGAGLCMSLFAHALAERGHELCVATAWHHDAPTTESERGIDVHRLKDLPSRAQWMSENPTRHTPAPFPDPEAVVRLRRIIKDFQPDLIPAYGWLAHSAAAALAGKDVPLVLWGHEYSNVCPIRSLYRLEREVCSGPAVAKCLHCASSNFGPIKGMMAVGGVLGMRPFLKRKTAAIHGVSRYVEMALDRDLRFDSSRSVVIPNFHEEVDHGPLPDDLRQRLPQEPYILFVGALRRVKGIEDLFAAYGQISNAPPLVLVGVPTPDTPAEFPAGVTLLESVAHSSVMAMWEQALFGVFPSRWPEPLATVVHEAMSCGRPVIATKPGGHVDMIDEGESGFVVPSADPGALRVAMQRLVDDEELRTRMGSTAMERARRYTEEKVVPQLEDFYYAVVDRRPLH